MVSSLPYFFAMVGGGWLATKVRAIRPFSPGEFLALLMASLAYLAVKFAMVVMGKGAVAYPGLFAVGLLWTWLLFRVTQTGPMFAFVRSRNRASWLVSLVGALTLEIYVLHGWVLDNSHLHYAANGAWRIPFPANIVVFWIVTIIGAVLLGRLVQLMTTLPLKGRPARN